MMTRRLLILSVFLLLGSAAIAAERPILVVYDFTSTFDGGKMGLWAAQIVRGHALRSGRYIGNPKITVDEVLGEHDFHPTVDTDVAKLAAFTRKAFQADLFVYGKVEKAGENFRVRFRVYRAGADGKPEKVLDETKDCPGKRYVPLAVDDVLNRVAGVRDAPTEWKLLAGELRAWSKELDGASDEAPLDVPVWRTKAANRQDKLLHRFRNVTARTNVDAANRALLDYLHEVLDAQELLQKSLTGTDADAAKRSARRLAVLGGGLAKSIDHWLDETSAEKRWQEGKDLVLNGGFEHGQKDPANWDPLKENMSWVDDPDGKSGKVVRFDMPRDVAATYGMLLYSEAIRVEPGATYRLRWRFKTMAPAVKLFIKGYAEFPKGLGFEGQAREVFRSRKDPQYGPRVKNEYEKGKWTEYGHDFVPFLVGKHDPKTGRFIKNTRQPRCIRLMLYAYWPQGVVYWDNIVVKKIKDAPVRPRE